MGDPIAGLSTSIQMQVYQHFDSPLEAKRLFARFVQEDGEGYRLFEALLGWVGADYPGNWDEWWAKHRDDGAVPQGVQNDVVGEEDKPSETVAY